MAPTIIASPGMPRFRHELADFWRFLWEPDLRRLPGRRSDSVLANDWWLGVSFGRLLAWAAVLWSVNLFVLGPIAVTAAGAGGIAHRLDPAAIPWLAAVLWAPLVEETLFRYGLRRPVQALWVCPAILPPLLWGMHGWTLAWVIAVLLLASVPLRRGRSTRARWHFSWRRRYLMHFGKIYHLSSLAFAIVHLNNFALDSPQWLALLLVLPQWATGLVLGWMRVRRGIGAAVALHSIFNAGPMLLIMVVLGLG
ncbi:MAG TPA: CPBP family glutamic-type intramembrane protease [Bordetella sp.]|nr:CPBP family glutamic-type intramembrane protease [Bordetella sp.]